jgi:hypothetical protein
MQKIVNQPPAWLTYKTVEKVAFGVQELAFAVLKVASRVYSSDAKKLKSG